MTLNLLSALCCWRLVPQAAVLKYFIRFKKNNIFNRSFLKNQLLNNFINIGSLAAKIEYYYYSFSKIFSFFCTVNQIIRNAYMKGQDVFLGTFREICWKYQNIKQLLSGILLSYIISFITFEYVFFSFSPKYLIFTQTAIYKCSTMSIFIIFLQKLIHTGKNLQQIKITVKDTLYYSL